MTAGRLVALAAPLAAAGAWASRPGQEPVHTFASRHALVGAVILFALVVCAMAVRRGLAAQVALAACWLFGGAALGPVLVRAAESFGAASAVVIALGVAIGIGAYAAFAR